MTHLSFSIKAAQRVYDGYIQRCRRALGILSPEDREDCLLEINSHIFEYIAAKGAANEMDALLDVLDRLGAPEETLKEVVASKKKEEAARTFNPKHLVQALILNIRNGIIYIILFILMLFELSFPLLAVLKLMHPDRVGLFIHKNGTFRFGYVNPAGMDGIGVGSFHASMSEEILGNWFIPTVLSMAIVLYLGIILLLRPIKKK